jgi:hypothetical protein
MTSRHRPDHPTSTPPVPEAGQRPGDGGERGESMDAEIIAVANPAPADEQRGNNGHGGPRMRIEVVPIASLSPNPANVRLHEPRSIDGIAGALRRFKQQKPLVVDQDSVVRAGNGTLAAARQLGWTEIAIVRTTLTGAELVAYEIADNRLAELSTWDDSGLAATLRALQDEEFDLDAVGFTDAEVDALFGKDADGGEGDGVCETPEPKVDEAAELQKKWGTRLGDLWIVPSEKVAGREHRLLCGDSTLAAEVDRLMGGATATMVFADPPYGYKYESNHYEGGNPFGMLLNDDRILDFATAAEGILATDCAVYTCSGHQTAHIWRNLLDPILTYKNTIVWKKNNWSMGDLYGAYAGQYEIIFFHHRGRPLLRGERSRDV